MNMLECAQAHARISARTRTHLEQNLKQFTAENEKARLVVLAYNKTKCKSICFCHTTCSSPYLTFSSRQLPILCFVFICKLLTLTKLPFPFAILHSRKIWSSKKEWYQKNRNTNTQMYVRDTIPVDSSTKSEKPPGWNSRSGKKLPRYRLGWKKIATRRKRNIPTDFFFHRKNGWRKGQWTSNPTCSCYWSC